MASSPGREERVAQYEDKTKIPLAALAVPILVESLIRSALLSADQVMLLGYSSQAVASMSVVGNYTFFIQLIYQMVGIGTSILIAQTLGAKRNAEAGKTALASMVLLGLFAVGLSVLVVILFPLILSLYNLESAVRDYAVRYITIVGGFSVFMAINIGQGTILRAWGHTRDAMYVSIVALCLNVLGNAISIYGLFGLPVLGVTGVAFSTVISQVAASIILAWRIRARREIAIPWKDVRRIPRPVYASILRVGVPTAGEHLSYNISQIFVGYFVSRLGTAALAAYTLVINVTRYVFIFGVSIGSAAQIKTGYLVGAGKQDEAGRKVWIYWAVACAFSAVAIVVVYFFREQILGLFALFSRKDDAVPIGDIIAIASSVLLVSVFLEPGRTFNTVIIPGLKGAGDVNFPVLIGLVSMWILGVGAAGFLGLGLGWGLVGIWTGMALDEWIRGIIIALRWKSGAWKGKALVRSAAAIEAEAEAEAAAPAEFR